MSDNGSAPNSRTGRSGAIYLGPGKVVTVFMPLTHGRILMLIHRAVERGRRKSLTLLLAFVVLRILVP